MNIRTTSKSPRNIRAVFSAVAVLHFLPLTAWAAEPVFTDPEQAGPDFAIQGEYVGEKVAAQVIALGKDKFRVVQWEPGLPGTSPEAQRKAEFDAVRSGDAVTFQSNTWSGTIGGGELTGKSGPDAFKLKRLIRESPTANTKPPAGAVVLFDGTNENQRAGGKLTKDGFLEAGAKSKESFGDYSLHLEFRTPFKPTASGQGRGNSGVYIRNCYEVQVLDSFGLVSKDDDCGAIYKTAKPAVNMCFPPLQWQTYDIDFENARYESGTKVKNAVLTVRHNGVLIHNRVEVPAATQASGSKEGPEPGPLMLQGHGSPVVYRNIWLVPKTAP